MSLKKRIEEELVPFGKLSKVRFHNSLHTGSAFIGNDGLEVERWIDSETAGEAYFKTLSPFRISLLEVKEAFLLIDEKVRFLESPCLKQVNTQLSCVVPDKRLLQELNDAGKVHIAADRSLYKTIVREDSPLIGMAVFFQGKKIATVIDLFNNNAHDVLVTEKENGNELLLPLVDEYVQEKDYRAGKIVFKNIQAFLEL